MKRGKKKPMLRKFGSVEYPHTPKTQVHADMYQKMFESFNDVPVTSRTFRSKRGSKVRNKILNEDSEL